MYSTNTKQTYWQTYKPDNNVQGGSPKTDCNYLQTSDTFVLWHNISLLQSMKQQGFMLTRMLSLQETEAFSLHDVKLPETGLKERGNFESLRKKSQKGERLKRGDCTYFTHLYIHNLSLNPSLE